VPYISSTFVWVLHLNCMFYLLQDGIGEELYCKLCNQYFISAHNKKEHMFGRQHLQNITSKSRVPSFCIGYNTFTFFYS